MKHELSLYENAIDSLNEALQQYGNGNLKEPRTYKFTILHLAQSVELIFKYYVSLKHPLFIYKNPFSKKIKSGTEKTITIHDAIQLLINCDEKINQEVIIKINSLKNLRNEIEHFKFSMNVIETKILIGNIVSLIDKIHRKITGNDILNQIDENFKKSYSELIDKHHAKITHCQATLLKEGKKIVSCHFCTTKDTAYLNGHEFKCIFCEKTDFIDTCYLCSQHEYNSHMYPMWHWNQEQTKKPLPSDAVLCPTCAYNYDEYLYLNER